jgi:hypothetical protein
MNRKAKWHVIFVFAAVALLLAGGFALAVESESDSSNSRGGAYADFLVFYVTFFHPANGSSPIWQVESTMGHACHIYGYTGALPPWDWLCNPSVVGWWDVEEIESIFYNGMHIGEAGTYKVFEVLEYEFSSDCYWSQYACCCTIGTGCYDFRIYGDCGRWSCPTCY